MALTNAQLIPNHLRRLCWILFPLPFIALLASRFIFNIELSGNEILALFHFFWMFAWAILIFSKEKQEDELVSQLRMKAFMSGVYFLLSGFLLMFFISWGRRDSFGQFDMTSVAIIDLLMFYIWVSFRVLLYLHTQDEE
jgi:hypothetical protein